MPGKPTDRQPGAPYPSPQDALHDGGDADKLATDVADTPEAEPAPPGAVPGHAVSTRVEVEGQDPRDDDEDGSREPSGAEFPQTPGARDPL